MKATSQLLTAILAASAISALPIEINEHEHTHDHDLAPRFIGSLIGIGLTTGLGLASVGVQHRGQKKALEESRRQFDESEKAKKEANDAALRVIAEEEKQKDAAAAAGGAPAPGPVPGAGPLPGALPNTPLPGAPLPGPGVAGSPPNGTPPVIGGSPVAPLPPTTGGSPPLPPPSTGGSTNDQLIPEASDSVPDAGASLPAVPPTSGNPGAGPIDKAPAPAPAPPAGTDIPAESNKEEPQNGAVPNTPGSPVDANTGGVDAPNGDETQAGAGESNDQLPMNLTKAELEALMSGKSSSLVIGGKKVPIKVSDN